MTEFDFTASSLNIAPLDEHNKTLLSNVHPANWQNPEPAPSYNLVIIGAGTAGLITASGAAGLGAKVALVERHLMGGDCLNVGCVPSKSILRSARLQAEILAAGQFGIRLASAPEVDFGKVMERMRTIRARISVHDAAARYRDLGVDVFLGQAAFVSKNQVSVSGKILPFKKAVIATGARAAVPPVEGLQAAGYLTNESLFNLTELPKRFGILGAGPIGCEMAQAFARFGSQVTLIDMAPQVLIREDPDAAKLLQQQLEREGVQLALGAKLLKVEKRPEGKVIHYETSGEKKSLVFDELLVSVGCVPNIENLGLEAAGVQYDKRTGVKVNDYLQTTSPNVFSCGDGAFKYQFTHTAEATAKIVIQNALFFGKKKTGSLIIPWCTYTDPEIAHVGLDEREAAERKIKIDIFRQPMAEVDRAITDGEENGFVKILLRQGTDQILGATIVAKHAGEILSEITLAMNGGIGLAAIADVIHPYPTQADAIKRIAYQYNRTRLKPWVKSLLTRFFAMRR